MYCEEKPNLVVVTMSGNEYHTTINHLVMETEVGGFDVDSVTIVTDGPISNDDYGTIVSAIVRSRYSPDDVEAILCNFWNPERTYAVEVEMDSLQKWRSHAKDVAKEAIRNVEASGIWTYPEIR